MAFSQAYLKSNRSNLNDSTRAIAPAFSQYASPDTLAEMTTPGYFPAYFGFNPDENFNIVVPNDILTVYSTTEYGSLSLLITSANPLTFSFINSNIPTYESFSIQSETDVADIVLPITFTRDSNGIITAFLTSTLEFSTVAPGFITFSPFILPSLYRPQGGTVYLPLAAQVGFQVNGSGWPFAQLAVTSGGVVLLDMADDFIYPQQVYILASTVNYIGAT
jgi:hypothetical protein